MLSLLALLITLALSWSKQIQRRRVNIHHNIQILGFPVNVFVRMWTFAHWGLHNRRTTWQLSDTSVSSKNSSLSWVYRRVFSSHYYFVTCPNEKGLGMIAFTSAVRFQYVCSSPSIYLEKGWWCPDNSTKTQTTAELVMVLWGCGH